MRTLTWARDHAAVHARALRLAFAWGSHDCVTFAGKCVIAVLGEAQAAPLLADWWQLYDSEASAAALLESLGGLEPAVRSRLGDPLPSVLQARRGDLLLLEDATPEGLDALGSCTGQLGAFARSPRGLAHLPLDQCSLAWRLG